MKIEVNSKKKKEVAQRFTNINKAEITLQSAIKSYKTSLRHLTRHYCRMISKLEFFVSTTETSIERLKNKESSFGKFRGEMSGGLKNLKSVIASFERFIEKYNPQGEIKDVLDKYYLNKAKALSELNKEIYFEQFLKYSIASSKGSPTQERMSPFIQQNSEISPAIRIRDQSNESKFSFERVRSVPKKKSISKSRFKNLKKFVNWKSVRKDPLYKGKTGKKKIMVRFNTGIDFDRKSPYLLTSPHGHIQHFNMLKKNEKKKGENNSLSLRLAHLEK